MVVKSSKYGGEKQHIPAVSSAASITYILIVLLIKRKNFQTKQNQFFIKLMNVCFKRIKKITEVSLSEHKRKLDICFALSLTFLCVNLTAINKKCFNKNLFLKISQHSPENTCVSIFFYKVTGLHPSGLHHRCFLVNNMKFLRIHLF